LERDPQAVLADVLDDFVALNTVEETFGVVIDKSTMTVDLKATEDLRIKMKAENHNNVKVAATT